jgi:large subunit ribosomal protein L23
VIEKRDHYRVLLAPIVSEKGYGEGQKGKYRFRVATDATKIEIRAAVEKAFKVHVLAVNVMNVSGKKRRLRMRMGETPAWKKAIVTLREGEHIDYYERA